MSNFHFGADDYDLNYHPSEASDGMGGVDWNKVEFVEIEGDMYLKMRTCKKLPPLIEQTCIVKRSGIEMHFGYWRCSACQCENFEGARFCMNCGAQVVE